MSPPQVNLAVKEPPTVSDEELPMEKKEKTEMPAIVTVETEKIRVQRADFQARRRRRVVCCVALIAVVLVGAAAAMVLGVRHHRNRHHHHHHHDRDHWSCDYGKEHINENVQVDHDHQLIHVHHNTGSQSQPSLHILHEYGRRMAAYKDVDHNVCYITRLDETFEEGYARWEGYEQSGRDPKTLRVFNKNPVEILVLQHVTDVHIYAHCHNSVSYWAVEIDEREVTTAMTTVKV